MNENKEIQKRGSGPVAMIKSYLLDNENMKARLADMLGKRGPAFANSIVNVVRNSQQLQKCTPTSVGSAAMIAATLNLPVDPVLGQAAIVPYGNQACFQIMYRGVIQLCIRSGQYATIHCSEIFADELKSHNPITGEVVFKEAATYKMRYAEKNIKNVIGHYAYFKLISGFEKAEYMTHAEVMAHAKKYSKAYGYDLKSGKGTSAWSTDPIAMGNKTVLIKLLKRYGIMSLEIQDALVSDRETFEEAQANATKRIEAEQGSEPIDTNFESQEPEASAEEAAARKAEADKQKADLAAGGKTTKRKKSVKKTAKKDKDKKPKYHCPNCQPVRDFDEAVKVNKNTGTLQCPKCLNWNVSMNDQPDFMNDEPVDPDIHEDNN